MNVPELLGANKTSTEKTTMNWKKFFFAFIAAFIFIFFFGWFFHEVLLKDTYAQLPSGLSRSADDFKSHFGWLVLGQLVFAFMFALIFASGFTGIPRWPGFPGGGVGSGVKLGIMLAFLGIGGHALITYATQPFPGNLIVYWSIGALVEMAIVGAIVGAIYKPSSRTTT